jgi:RNA polymerase sigma factor (sigma-70 family)
MERAEGAVGEELFQGVARSESWAIDEVCRRYGPRVAAMVRPRMWRRLRRRLETADLAQEAMAEIARQVPGVNFSSEADFLRWTAAVVEHKVLQAARRWAARSRAGRAVPIDACREAADPLAETPSRLYRRREDAEKISEALAGLAQDDRRIVIARLLLGLRWPEVAASLGTTIPAAQMRLQRARGRLVKALRRSGIERAS